jgi:hypothetical protein
MDQIVSVPWAMDWVWSLPLITISVMIHVVGLMLIFRGVVHVMSSEFVRRCFTPMFVASRVRSSLANLANLDKPYLGV